MIKVLLEAPILTQSGYGEHARLVYKSLSQREDVDIYINSLIWGKTPLIMENKDKFFQKINSDIYKMQDYVNSCKEKGSQLQFDMQVHVGIPSEFKKRAPYSVHITAGIETDRVSANWLINCNKGIDKVIVPSLHSKNGFLNTRYEVENRQTKESTILYCNPLVEVVPYPVKQVEPVDLDFITDTDFNFLSIAMLGPRKNIQNMIKWFCEEFKDDNVGLILKTSIASGGPIDKEATVRRIQEAIPAGEKKCKIYLLHGNLNESEIHSLYSRRDVHCYLTTTHGEGFGLPIFEAAYNGIPVIATDWSAHVEFLTASIQEKNDIQIKKLFSPLDYDLNPIPTSAVWKDILEEGSRWAYPKEDSFKSQVRKVYEDYETHKNWAKMLKVKLLHDYSEEKILKRMGDLILEEGYLDGFVPYNTSRTREEMLKNWRIKS